MLLIAAGYANVQDKMPPTWVIWACYLAIGAGTLFGGWRIVKTMGSASPSSSRWAASAPRPAAR
jgi:phosphate/sulfate permease